MTSFIPYNEKPITSINDISGYGNNAYSAGKGTFTVNDSNGMTFTEDSITKATTVAS